MERGRCAEMAQAAAQGQFDSVRAAFGRFELEYFDLYQLGLIRSRLARVDLDHLDLYHPDVGRIDSDRRHLNHPDLDRLDLGQTDHRRSRKPAAECVSSRVVGPLMAVG